MTLRPEAAMHDGPFDPWTSAPSSRDHIDDTLWEKIDEVFGGAARLSGTLMIETHGPQRPIMVVVVEQRGLPGDEELRRRFLLTPREREVARLMADRLSNGEISRRLGISVHTVRRHCERVLAKLEIQSRNQVRGALLDPHHAPALRTVRSVA